MSNLYSIKTVCCIAFLVMVFENSEAVAQVLISATDRGWYVNNGFHGPDNDNYLVGDPGNQFDESEYRNWFVFNLSGVTQPALAAELRLFNPISPPGAANGFESVHGSETYTVFDITTSVTNLAAGTGGVAAFSDLGSGTIYATRTMTVADNGTTVIITLNAAGLAYLNANLGSTVAMGGAITTLDADFVGSGESAFGATRSTQPSVPATAAQLMLAVPEPGTVVMVIVLAGSVLVVWWMRRRQAQRTVEAIVS